MRSFYWLKCWIWLWWSWSLWSSWSPHFWKGQDWHQRCPSHSHLPEQRWQRDLERLRMLNGFWEIQKVKSNLHHYHRCHHCTWFILVSIFVDSLWSVLGGDMFSAHALDAFGDLAPTPDGDFGLCSNWSRGFLGWPFRQGEIATSASSFKSTLFIVISPRHWLMVSIMSPCLETNTT